MHQGTIVRTDDSQRARGFIDENKYQRLLVWERKCGLLVMDPKKCSTCELALRETPDEGLVPLVKDMVGKSSPFFARAKQNVRRD